MNELGTDNTCGHSQDGITHKHDDGTEETAHGGDGGDVSITNGGHGYNSPIDTGGDVRKGRPLDVSLYHVHEGSHRDDHDNHEEEKDHNLATTKYKGAQEEVAFLKEAEQLEYTEHPDKTEGTHYHQVTYRTYNPPYIQGQGAEQVYYAKETEGILARLRGTIEAQEVLQGKEKGEDILQYREDLLGKRSYPISALYHHYQNT
jgi:hypothetical protein